MSSKIWPVLAVIVMVASLAGVALFGALGSIAERTAPPSGPRIEAPRRDRVDRMFIEQMVPHHEDAIAMAELAATRAEHQEIRDLAASIAKTQSEENDLMRQWYRDWFGGEVPDARNGFGMMDRMDGTDLQELRDAEDFDRVFIEQMVPHHRMAIMMARMANRTTQREEMRELTDSIIESQGEEIDQMQSWYAEWYGL